MNKLLSLLGIALIFCLGILYFLPSLQQDIPSPSHQQPQQIVVKSASLLANAQNIQPPAPITKETQIAQAFSTVAQQYSQQLNFPAYSIPLNKYDEQLLAPRRFLPINFPLQQGSVSLALNQYRYIHPENILLKVNIQGSRASAARLVLYNIEDIEHKALFEKSLSGDGHEFTASWPGSSDWPQQLQLIVWLTINGQQQPLSTEFEYHQPPAIFEGVNTSSIVDNDLVIENNITVHEAGLYRLRANFYHEQQPIAVLSQEQTLAEGSQKVNLKVHQSLLNQEGPWILKEIQLEKRSQSPLELNRFGLSTQSEYEVPAQPLSSLDRQQYQANAQEQQKLEYLKQLAGEH